MVTTTSNTNSYKQQTVINEFQQKPKEKKQQLFINEFPEETKYHPMIQQTVLSKPKNNPRKAAMDARIAKRKEKRIWLKHELPKNTGETNKLKNFNKKPKRSI